MTVIGQRQGFVRRIVIAQVDRQEILRHGGLRDNVDRRLLVPTAQVVEIVPMRRICYATGDNYDNGTHYFSASVLNL